MRSFSRLTGHHATPSGRRGPVEHALFRLQRSAGNHAVQREYRATDDQHLLAVDALYARFDGENVARLWQLLDRWAGRRQPRVSDAVAGFQRAEGIEPADGVITEDVLRRVVERLHDADDVNLALRLVIDWYDLPLDPADGFAYVGPSRDARDGVVVPNEHTGGADAFTVDDGLPRTGGGDYPGWVHRLARQTTRTAAVRRLGDALTPAALAFLGHYASILPATGLPPLRFDQADRQAKAALAAVREMAPDEQAYFADLVAQVDFVVGYQAACEYLATRLSQWTSDAYERATVRALADYDVIRPDLVPPAMELMRDRLLEFQANGYTGRCSPDQPYGELDWLRFELGLLR